MITELAVVALLVVAVPLWMSMSLVRLRRHRIATEDFLCDEDPSIRIITLQVVQCTGIRPYVPLLRWRTQVEQDPTVLSALSGLLSINTWRTGKSRELMELRHWAIEYRSGQSALVSAPVRWVSGIDLVDEVQLSQQIPHDTNEN